MQLQGNVDNTGSDNEDHQDDWLKLLAYSPYTTSNIQCFVSHGSQV